MARREYMGAAALCRLSTIIDADDTTIIVSGDTDDWPTGASAPFYIEIDREVNGSAEKILVDTRVGNTLTVAGSGNRGVDGTTAVPHEANATVEHVIDAGTIDEANAHVNDDTRDDHSQYLTSIRHDSTVRHLLGTSVPAGSPGTSSPGDTGSAGVSTSAARADHRHARADNYGVVGSIQAEAIASTASAGTSSTTARADHRHAMPSGGTPGASAPGDTASEGSSSSFARADHRHAREQTLGITHGEDKNDGDTSAIAGGASLTVATYALTTTAARIIEVDIVVTVRASSVDAFAGNVHIKMNGSTMFGATRRFHTYGAYIPTISSVPQRVAFRTKTAQPAGSYTFTVVVENDPGAVSVIASTRNLNVYTEGG